MTPRLAPGSITRIGWRNLWRNRRRTILALSAIGLAQALVLIYDGILGAYGDWMVATVTGPMLGHVQAHAPGWRKDRAMDKTIRNAAGVLAAVGRDRGVVAASGRVYAPALAAAGAEGFAVVVVGIAPDVESRPMGLLSSAGVTPGGRRILMGRLLAEATGVKVGDEIALVGQGVDGSLANDLYTVAALVNTPVDFINRQALLMEIGQAQQLFALTDEVHEVVIHGRDPERAATLAAEIAALPALRGTEVLDWKRLAPDMVTLIDLVRVAWVLILGLVFVAAAAGVANTMLMATFERTRELGMFLALGAGPGRVVQMIVTESIALGVVGALLGTALGLGVVAVTHRTGLDLTKLGGAGPSEISFAGLSWSMRLFPVLRAVDVVRACAAVALTSLLASIWPAVRAARLQPVDAMRA